MVRGLNSKLTYSILYPIIHGMNEYSEFQPIILGPIEFNGHIQTKPINTVAFPSPNGANIILCYSLSDMEGDVIYGLGPTLPEAALSLRRKIAARYDSYILIRSMWGFGTLSKRNYRAFSLLSTFIQEKNIT